MKKRFLLVNFGGLGDEVMFLPAVSLLKKHFPDSHISLCLEPRSAGILSLTSNIDDLIKIDIKSKYKYFELIKFVFKAMFGNYDAVISSGSNPLIAILLKMTGIKKRIGYKSKYSSLLTSYANLDKNKYAGEMYADLVLAYLNSEKIEVDSYDCIPEIKSDKINGFEDFYVIHPGVSKMSVRKNILKNFSAEIWVEIIQKLIENGKKVVLAGGPDDKEYIDEISKKIPENENFINYYGKTSSVSDLAKLINSSYALICTDSAPMHIGIALRKKVFAFFAPTNEKVLVPKNADVKVIQNNVECRPCLWHKRNVSCENPKCLSITADEFVNEILS